MPGMALMYDGAAGAVPAAAAGLPAKFSTSFDVIIPSIPLPDAMRDRSIPRSEANNLAAGLAKGRSPETEVLSGGAAAPPAGPALMGRCG